MDKATNFSSTDIDIDVVVKKWSHLWSIAQWNETYRIVKYRRKEDWEEN